MMPNCGLSEVQSLLRPACISVCSGFLTNSSFFAIWKTTTLEDKKLLRDCVLHWRVIFLLRFKDCIYLKDTGKKRTEPFLISLVYFRSNRKMRPRRVFPEKEALYFIASGKDKDTFEKKFMSEEKGFGVIATKTIEPGEFLLEYVGRHITGSEGETLSKDYSAEDAVLFLYFYSFLGRSYCVDGSKDTERLGRFINDDHIKPNSKIKIIMDEKKRPHLCAFALTKINAGEEIIYDYGDPNCPWRQSDGAD
ncbi:N-lysine methyltransferase KMT5A-A-like [Xyrauchen texanus]|uniref:N-lysine methyltransferase KMT5A-A-like n=1 Tax=Xyrauchen texanus TaxID=154827 RepID=UPI0022428301|nr:N-lysine methyltransferase KMT5A-A-like [Xyrauchen texanus]